MNTQNNQPRIIDFLALSDAEKADFLKETRKYLKQQLEEAKFMRTFSENEIALIQDLPPALDQDSMNNFT